MNSHPSPAVKPGAGVRGPAVSRKLLRAWLLACAAMVFAVLVVGGVTRLTHSGLSIVHWDPVTGIVPPLSETAWQALFDQYRTSPEFRDINGAMTLEGFKPIFWWEYAHRLLGRLAGVVFLLPLLAFLHGRCIERRLALRLLGIFCLGALQGALGWFMVASGLVDDPQVSPIRLAAHLGMALLLIGLLLWTAWTLPGPDAPPAPAPAAARVAVLAVFLMALTGALVAGTHAGYVYNTFPLMGGQWVPPDVLAAGAWNKGFLANLAGVQFVHRLSACLVIAAVLVLARHLAGRGPAAAPAARLLLAALALQLGLGIATLVSGVALPLAAAHQAGAVLLFASTLWAARAAAPAGTRAASVTASAGP